MKLLIMQFPPSSRHFISLRSKYSITYNNVQKLITLRLLVAGKIEFLILT
jgi:hypothetical protein